MTTTNQHSTTTPTTQSVPRHHRRSALLLAGLIAVGAGGYTIDNRTNHPATEPGHTASLAPRQSDAGLSLMLGRDYPAGAWQIAPTRHEASGFEATVDPSVSATAPTNGDAGLEVLFGSIATEAAWSTIRYSPNPGLALIFSELYPRT